MKLAFSLFLTIFGFQVGFAFPEKRSETPSYLKNLSREVNDIINELREYEGNVVLGLTDELNKAGKVFLQNVDDIVNNILKEIETSGKATDSCYKIASENLNVISRNIQDEVGDCQLDTTWANYGSVSEDVDYFAKTGNDLIKRIDSIVEGCELMTEISSTMENREIPAKEQCLIRQEPGVKIFVNGLKNESEEVKKLSNDFAKEAVTKGKLCTEEAKSKFIEESIKVKEASVKCIAKH